MIFAEMEYEQDYWVFHSSLVEFVESHFSNVKSGLQSDSWIWVPDGSSKVAIDTFSSMKHQVKCKDPDSDLIREVIDCLSSQYSLRVYQTPELEAHEEC